MTSTVALLVQPVSRSVTVTVYIPGTDTAGFCWLEENPAGPVQANETLENKECTCRITQGLCGVSIPPEAEIGGGSVNCLINILSDFEQNAPPADADTSKK